MVILVVFAKLVFLWVNGVKGGWGKLPLGLSWCFCVEKGVQEE